MERHESDQFVEHLTGCQRQLNAYLLTLLANRHDADEVLQDTNLTIWRKRDEFELGTNFLAWAYRVAHFQALAYRQKQARDRLIFDDDLTQIIAEEFPEPQSLDERRDALAQCMDGLPNRERTLLNLRYGTGASVEEMAAQLHKRANTVAQALHRLRLALMDCVQRRLMGRAT